MNWSPFNSTFSSQTNTQDAYNAFKYTRALSISSFPLSGVYTEYLGGGYVYKMGGDSNDLISNFTFLEENNWIDRRTRAVFIEFGLFNPNINMFVYGYLLFEFLPTGSIVKSFRFLPMTLFDGRNSLFSFGTLCAVIYISLIFAITMRQIFVIKVERMNYFKSLWSYFDLSLIAFSLAAFAIWLYRIWEAQRLMSLFSKPGHEGKFLNLQMLAYWDDLLSCMLAMCACLGSLKFMKILKFNRTIRALINTMRIASRTIFSFGCIFLICMFAWIQAGFILFSAQIAGLSTFVKSIETCFLILMGKFELSAMLTASPVLTVIFFTSFNILIVMVLLNMFISLVTDSFAEAKKEENLADPLDLDEFMLKKVKGFLCLFESRKNKTGQTDRVEEKLMRKSLSQNSKYMNELQSLNYKTTHLMDVINLVCFNHQKFFRNLIQTFF